MVDGVSEQYCLQRVFEAQAARVPNNVAVVYEGQCLTYRELNDRTNQLARFIRKKYKNLFQKALLPDTLLGLAVERGIATIIGILGILKAGGAYVPLDPAYPEERLKFIVDDAGLSLLITSGQGTAQVVSRMAASQDVAVICLDQDEDLISREETANIDEQDVLVTADSLAYVIYTSGSTGKPKGVLIEHHNVWRLFTSTKDLFNFTAQDVWTMFHSFAFDFSVWEIWGALLHGGRLVVVPYWISRNPEDFYALVQREQVTILNQTPAAFMEFIKEDAKSQERLTSLRYVIFGGEALVPTCLQSWVDKYDWQQPRLVNMYGITETTVHVTYLFLTPDDLISELTSPIGECIADLFCYVVDERGKEVEVGEVGELYVGGAGLARGYLNRAELNLAKFIPNPFVSTPQQLLYKTGDAVRRLANGKLDYIGRIDNQVKIRGFRIELGEIEAVLGSYPGVKQAVVAVREIGVHKQLVAYYVTNDDNSACNKKTQDGKIKQAALFQYIKSQLPAYMVPAYLMQLAIFPLTINGKIDKKALPEVTIDFIRDANNYSAARNNEEKILAAIWSDVLQLAKVGITDDFFAIGGDSIRAIQIVSRAREQGLFFTSKQLFTFPTIAELATQVEHQDIKVDGEDNGCGEILLGPIQQRYFRTSHKNHNTFYQACLIELEQALTLQQVKIILHKLINHHDILRARFICDDNAVWRQTVAAEITDNCFYCEEVFTADRDEKGLTDLLGKLQSKLNIVTGPLVGVALFRDHARSRSELLLLIHHLVVDGVSWRILYEDVKKIITQQALPAKTTSMQNCAKAFYAYLPTAEQEWAYWLNVGQNAATTQYPIAVNSDMHHCLITLDQKITQLLVNDIAVKYHTQINDILLTALLLAANIFFNKADLLIQLEGHGREDCIVGIDFSRTVGWFTSFFPVYLRLPDGWQSNDDLGTVIKHVKETLRAVPNKGLGYAILRFLSQDQRTKILDELEDKCAICFNYLGVLDSPIYEADLADNKVNTNARLFEINAWVAAGKFNMDIAYNNLVYVDESGQKFANLLKGQLITLVEFCHNEQYCYYTPSDFPLVKVSQHFLDRLAATNCQIENIYALAPLQYGLLFHSLYAPTSDQYCVQIHWRYTGTIELSCLLNAWRMLIKQHAVLRTAFFWENVIEPLQIVYDDAELEWGSEDWSKNNLLDETEIAKALDVFLQQERIKPFVLTKPCLMRFHVINLGNEQYELVWSSHHLILDGWCVPLIFDKLQRNYVVLIEGKHCSSALLNGASYKHYLFWLDKQDKNMARNFWQDMVHDVIAPTNLTRISLGSPQFNIHKAIVDVARQKFIIKDDLLQQVMQFVQEQRITLSTLLQFVWAMVLARYVDSDDVIFGMVVAGRSAEIKQVENIVGLFINTLPVRVRLSRKLTMTEQLQKFFGIIQDVNQYSYLSLSEIQKFATNIAGEALFYSIFDFENVPVITDCDDSCQRVFDLSAVTIWEKTNYPLAINVLAGMKLTMVFSYDAEVFSTVAIEALILHYKTALEWLLHNVGENLSRFTLLNLPATAKENMYCASTTNQKVQSISQNNLLSQLTRAEIEKILLNIWRDLLQLAAINVDDNFFSLGGDSIISIQMISRAREFGLNFKLQDLFLYPTIRQLAQHVTLSTQVDIDQGLVTGTVVLTPIQHWFFANKFANLNYYNQSCIFKLRERISCNDAHKILEYLLQHHDGLRLRFRRDSAGKLEQLYANDFSIDIATMDILAYQEIEKISAKLQSGLDIKNGPVLKAILFNELQHNEQYLFMVMHHLLIDSVSWRILVADFERLYLQLKRKQPLILPLKTSSYKAWSEALNRYSEVALLQLDFWLAMGKNAESLPYDVVDKDKIFGKKTRTSLVEFDVATTRKLLRNLPTIYHTRVNEVLLLSLIMAIKRWCGVGKLLIDIEGHGREDCVAGVDVSRTVGWFTSIYPVYLSLDNIAADSDGLVKGIAYIKEQLAAVPDKGIGFGVLRYLVDEKIRHLFGALRHAEILFNYLGVMDNKQSMSQQPLLQYMPNNFAADSDPANQLSYAIEINALVVRDRLQIFIDYQATRFKESSIIKFQDILQNVTHDLIVCNEGNNSHASNPAILNYSQLSQKSLALIMQEDKE